MSCGQPADEAVEMPARPPPPKAGPCAKCRSKDIVFTRTSASYCLECFEGTLARRFKDIMFYAKEYCRAPRGSGDRPNGTLLIAMSGGLASRTTLDLLKRNYPSTSEGASKAKLAFEGVELLHITSQDEPVSVQEELRDFVEEQGYNLTVIDESTVYEASQAAVSPNDPALTLKPGETSIPLADFASFSSTSRETVISNSRFAFIVEYAASKGHKAVLFNESSTRLAAKTLSAMSKGQGWNIGEMVSGSNVPILGSDVRVYRPLSGISGEEIRFYSKASRNWPAQAASQKRTGIDGLTEKFVNELEVGFPSTVSVIGRTASKLGMRSGDPAQPQTACPLCTLPSDPEARKWRAVATLSRLQPEDPSLDPVESADLSEKKLADLLCYGCLVPFLQSQAAAKPNAEQEVVMLPAYVQKVAQTRETKQESLRAEIAEYLL